jgi:hypothetical protein
MLPIYQMTVEVVKIIDRQAQLFPIEDYAIEPTDTATIDIVGDWEWEQESIALLPKPTRKPKQTLSSLILQESVVHDDLDLLPKTELVTLPKIEDEIREQALMTYAQFLEKFLGEKSRIKLLPKSIIREQLEQGIEIPGKSIVKVKGKVYILTQPKSTNNQLPKNWWRDIKQIGKHQYLYARWREGDRQKSKSLGRVDLVD